MNQQAFILAFFLFLINPVIKGNTGVDINDSTRVNLLNHQAKMILNDNPDKAAELASEAKFLADQLSYQYGLIESLKILGRAYKFQKEYLTALEHYLQASKALENQGDITSLADMQLEIGMFFSDWGVHEKAAEYYNRSYSSKQTLEDTLGQIELLRLLGDTHYQLKNRKEAQMHYGKLLNREILWAWMIMATWPVSNIFKKVNKDKAWYMLSCCVNITNNKYTYSADYITSVHSHRPTELHVQYIYIK